MSNHGRTTHNAPDYGLSRGTPLFPFRPTEKHRSHSLQRKALICELARSALWLRSLRCTVPAIVAVAPFVCRIAVSALFMPGVTLSQIDVLMAYGRCLRPALYSSLRSSPSHPTGVSALRVTIAIANARFARKQWGLRKSTANSRRLFRNESATSRRVRAGAIVGSTAMIRTAFCRKSPRVPRVCWLGSWALGTIDGGRQGKSAAFGRAHVVGGVEVLMSIQNDQGVAQWEIIKEIKAARAVGLRKLAVRPS